MKGRGIGTLEVFYGDKTSSLTSIWNKTGEQPDPDQWKTSTLELPQLTNPVVSILLISKTATTDKPQFKNHVVGIL